MEDLLKLPELTWEEIQKHTDEKSCWCVFYGLVYDLTKFLNEHPGSPHVILEVAGQDATEAFEDVGHSFQAQLAADEYIIGRVKGATEIRKCKRDTAGYSSHLAKSGKSSTPTSLIVVMSLVVLIGVWAYFHFQDEDIKLYHSSPTAQHQAMEY